MHNRDYRKRKMDSKHIGINYGWKPPKPKEGNRYSDIGSKQDGPKQTYTKTYYNKTGFNGVTCQPKEIIYMLLHLNQI